MSEMPEKKGFNHGMIFTAAVSFIVATLIIATQFKLQLIDILVLVLVIGSVLIVAFERFMSKDAALAPMLKIAQVVIALIVSLRFGLPLLFDLQSISTLLLFGSIILFFYIAVTGIISFVTATRAAKPEATEVLVVEEVVAEPEPEEVAEPVVDVEPDAEEAEAAIEGAEDTAASDDTDKPDKKKT